MAVYRVSSPSSPWPSHFIPGARGWGRRGGWRHLETERERGRLGWSSSPRVYCGLQPMTPAHSRGPLSGGRGGLPQGPLAGIPNELTSTVRRLPGAADTLLLLRDSSTAFHRRIPPSGPILAVVTSVSMADEGSGPGEAGTAVGSAFPVEVSALVLRRNHLLVERSGDRAFLPSAEWVPKESPFETICRHLSQTLGVGARSGRLVYVIHERSRPTGRLILVFSLRMVGAVLEGQAGRKHPPTYYSWVDVAHLASLPLEPRGLAQHIRRDAPRRFPRVRTLLFRQGVPKE